MKFKRTITAAGIAAATLLTAGCMSLTADITLDGQAKGSGSMVISVNKQVASLAGIGSADAFKSQVTGGDTALPPNAKIETSESDTDYIATVSFKDAVMDDEEFGAEVLGNGNVKFTFVNEGSEPTTEDDAFGDVDMGNATLTVNFPGEVTDFSGEGATKVDADTVKWAFPLTTSTTATATSLVAASALPRSTCRCGRARPRDPRWRRGLRHSPSSIAARGGFDRDGRHRHRDGTGQRPGGDRRDRNSGADRLTPARTPLLRGSSRVWATPPVTRPPVSDRSSTAFKIQLGHADHLAQRREVRRR